jgi:hypothetical protein
LSHATGTFHGEAVKNSVLPERADGEPVRWTEGQHRKHEMVNRVFQALQLWKHISNMFHKDQLEVSHVLHDFNAQIIPGITLI